MIRNRIIVRGVVQMVGYRYFTRNLAHELNLGGYAKNRPDGSVEVEVEGEGGLVGEFIKQLRIGPRAAHVTGLDIEELDPGSHYDGFEIRF